MAEAGKLATAELTFRANQFQERVKARFFRRVEEMSHVYDLETVLANKDLVLQMAGTERILDWFEKPGFAVWFLDQDYLVDGIHAVQQDALSVVAHVLHDDAASPADRLKAARMLLELGDQFPGRKSEVRFLDERLNAMSESETEKEIKRLEKALEDD